MSEPGGRRAARTVAAAGAAALALAVAGPAAGASPPPKDGGGPEPKAGAAREFGRVAPGADALLVTFTDRPDRRAVARRLSGLGEVSPVVPEAGVWRLRPVRREGAVGRAERRHRVLAAEWPLARRATERVRPAPPLEPIAPRDPFTDPLQIEQWMLSSNGWSPALTGRGPRQTIAILDGGVAVDHPEWSGKASPLLPGHSVFPGRAGAGADDWGVSGHGTHVAGIAAAPANGVGIVGVAPGDAGGARVLPVQVADRFGEFSDEALIRGIRYAVTRGARIINISAGGEGDMRAFQETIYWATRRGAVIVAAVGNDGDAENERKYPAAYRRVIGVGAQCGPDTTFDCPRRFGVARFSNHNDTVDLVAPGVGIVSSVPRRVTQDRVEEGYALKDGTSMSAPYVAGAIALVQAANGNALSPSQVLRHLERTATDLGAPGRDDFAGHGAVDLVAATTRTVPADDEGEVNDDIRFLGAGGTPLTLGGGRLRIDAHADQSDDPDDVYPVSVRRGQRLRVELANTTGRMELWLWGPGTRTVASGERNLERNLLAFAGRPSRRQVLVVRAPRSGRYFLNVYARRGASPYTLRAWTQP